MTESGQMCAATGSSVHPCYPARNLMRKARGFSLLELLSAVILISVFAAFLLDRLSFYQEAVEKAHVEFTIAKLKSALRIQMALLISQGRMRDFALLEQQNPMDWLDTEKPLNYRGVSNDSNPKPGYWEFNANDRTLIYWIADGKYFQPDRLGSKRIRLRVKLSRDSSSSLGETEKPVSTIRLEFVEPYVWLK